MITSLYIKNIALIQELSIELGKGLNILSGETGAGKSIIIDSLNFVLGDRADRSLIRYGENMARVEVVFENINQKVNKLLEDYGIEYEDTIIIGRMMTEEKSECRINGRIVNLSTLRAVVALLVDVHSQNEHQSLMKVASHIKLLDEFSSESLQIKTEYLKSLDLYNSTKKKLSEYSSAADRERLIDVLRYQIEEIMNAKIYDGEETELTNDRLHYYNYQKIYNALSSSAGLLEGANGYGGISSLTKAVYELNSIKKYDESLEAVIDRLDSVKIEAEDILSVLNEKISNDSIENTDIEKIEKRIDEIRLLKKKYGQTIKEINEFLEKAKEKLYFLENAEQEIEKLNKTIIKYSQELIDFAKKLHNIRMKNAGNLSKATIDVLNDLGMKNTVFEINVIFPDDDDLILDAINNSGADTVEFLLSPNVGEPAKPLIKIASGGEMSRFMLAMKNVIADIDHIDTLVFDEIDTGISGKIAKEVAMKLYNIAKNRQVIAVTHLPQLASMADRQYLISKKVEDNKTVTGLQLLNGNDVYNEIMRLAGSAENSEIGLSHAKELKEWANNYKKTLKYSN